MAAFTAAIASQAVSTIALSHPDTALFRFSGRLTAAAEDIIADQPGGTFDFTGSRDAECAGLAQDRRIIATNAAGVTDQAIGTIALPEADTTLASDGRIIAANSR